jgi:hypothetical protein
MALDSSVVGRLSVLEMIRALETHRGDEELQAISGLLDELSDYIKRSENRVRKRTELILRARQIRGVVGI